MPYSATITVPGDKGTIALHATDATQAHYTHSGRPMDASDPGIITLTVTVKGRTVGLELDTETFATLRHTINATRVAAWNRNESADEPVVTL